MKIIGVLSFTPNVILLRDVDQPDEARQPTLVVQNDTNTIEIPLTPAQLLDLIDSLDMWRQELMGLNLTK